MSVAVLAIRFAVGRVLSCIGVALVYLQSHATSVGMAEGVRDVGAPIEVDFGLIGNANSTSETCNFGPYTGRYAYVRVAPEVCTG